MASSGASIANALEGLLKELKSKSNTALKKTWTQRMEDQEENWQEMRGVILDALIASNAIPDSATCMECNNPATIRCKDCALHGYFLCHECDMKTHIRELFHRREMWMNGYFEPVPSGSSVKIHKQSHTLIGYGM